MVHLIFTQARQIFECLREVFTEMPWSTCSRLVQKKNGEKKIPTETPDHFWPF